jgi:hypothetical protein
MNSPAPSTSTSGAKSRKSQAKPTAGDETGCREYGDGRPQCDENLTMCVQTLHECLHGLGIGGPQQLANWNGDKDCVTTSLFVTISGWLGQHYPNEEEGRPTWCPPSSSSTRAGG